MARLGQRPVDAGRGDLELVGAVDQVGRRARRRAASEMARLTVGDRVEIDAAVGVDDDPHDAAPPDGGDRSTSSRSKPAASTTGVQTSCDAAGMPRTSGRGTPDGILGSFLDVQLCARWPSGDDGPAPVDAAINLSEFRASRDGSPRSGRSARLAAMIGYGSPISRRHLLAARRVAGAALLGGGRLGRPSPPSPTCRRRTPQPTAGRPRPRAEPLDRRRRPSWSPRSARERALIADAGRGAATRDPTRSSWPRCWPITGPTPTRSPPCSAPRRSPTPTASAGPAAPPPIAEQLARPSRRP